MFDRVSEAAEKLATNISRRAFMGRLGKGSLTLAAVLGGMFSFHAQAQAGKKSQLCCLSPNGSCWKIINPLLGCGSGRLVVCSQYKGCPG